MILVVVKFSRRARRYAQFDRMEELSAAVVRGRKWTWRN